MHESYPVYGLQEYPPVVPCTSTLEEVLVHDYEEVLVHDYEEVLVAGRPWGR